MNLNILGCILIITLWITILSVIFSYIIFRIILPKYKNSIANESLSDIILTLNVVINTELELWENDVFVDKSGIGNNSQYENFYNEICNNIIESLSPSYFDMAERYLKKEAIVTIIARRTKNFLNDHVQEAFPNPTTKILFPGGD